MYTASRIDPGIHCYPLGVPRLGAPSEIAQTPTSVYMLYDGEHAFRAIPIGGDHKKDQDPVPDGDAVAQWDGDTQVADTVNIDPDTWLDVTIEDPTLFTGPWKPKRGFAIAKTGSTALLLNTSGGHASEGYGCVERDREHKVNNDRF